jgi:hypothetical protein
MFHLGLPPLEDRLVGVFPGLLPPSSVYIMLGFLTGIVLGLLQQQAEDDSGKEPEHDADGAGGQEAGEDPDESVLKWRQAEVEQHALLLTEKHRDGAEWGGGRTWTSHAGLAC